MKRSVLIYFVDILEYMNRAEEYIEGMTFKQFSTDRKTCDATIRCIEVIGEATKQIPDSICINNPSIPWRAMAGMRDKIIHSYFTVDLEAVWLVIKTEIPKLKPLLKQIQEVLENIEDCK
ncbi:MAG: HepT-like ribonuclease domain-containing protein [Candidatus Thorarchaeota archaeon]